MTAVTTVAPVEDPRELALLKAVGLDRLQPEQRELALNIAGRYELDLMLKHLVMIDGRPYITRDGLLHVAHRSGFFDGMETTVPILEDGFWRSTCSVYRKDMSHPFTYTGRYPEKGNNAKFAPEMAVKVGEVMSLRRAFDVAAPAFEERWDVTEHADPTPTPTLAERVAEKAAEVETVGTYTADLAKDISIAPDAPEPPVDVAAEAQRIFGEDEAPVGALSVEDIKAKAKEAHILPAVLATYIESLFGEKIQLANLTNEQRFALWEAVKP